jgi:hypothetical protein
MRLLCISLWTKVKIKMYRIIILLEVLYECQVWPILLRQENTLKVLKKKGAMENA